MKFYKSLCLLGLMAFSSYSSNSFAEEKTLNVVTEPTFAPFEFVDKGSSALIGFDIDIINAIGEVEGYKMNVSSMSFDGQIPAIITQQVDIAISGFTITKERAQKVNFSEPYYDAGLGILITKNNSDEIKTKEDLKGKTICAQLGTSGAMYAEKVEGSTVSQFNSTADAFLEMEKGSCSAVVTDKPVIEYYLATTNKDNLVMIPEQLTVEQYGIVTSKNRQDLTDMIASGLKKIRENGTYDKIYQKWFGNAAK
ncbi:basic amino acid ABC transporter substrate-binding protein [uncultured Succinivibrio sp.]|uniref:basic amino acid ABC transporter substrate-binding protein n=1 Tax=uncultured Succinivibrio sp. TaxID=540749 RepID=UPI0025F5C0BF|nr:basic amino acid ABC transporter substrate-binding protein [uncultured Succinivibrio sp.]